MRSIFENHILYEKVISIKIIVIIISLGYPLYSLLFGLYFQLGCYPVCVTHVTCRLATSRLPERRMREGRVKATDQQKLETGFERV